MKQAVKNVEEVKAILKKHKDEVVHKYRVSEIGIFGSFVPVYAPSSGKPY